MNTEQILELTSQYIMPTYGRLPIAFVRGEGAHLWDAEGKEYLDFVAGIAVLGVGHCHPKVVEAIREQAGLLMHTSNLYNIAPQALLAKKLSELSFGGKTFFCNSGAEANEAAIKLARKWAH
ncbi:MAG: aminotransferase class III-fold pyridoxal phosphate-dependent enzyme, partial [Armatimonadia bacterium]